MGYTLIIIAIVLLVIIYISAFLTLIVSMIISVFGIIIITTLDYYVDKQSFKGEDIK